MSFNKINLIFTIQVLYIYLTTVYVLASFNSDPIETCSSVNGEAGECVPVNQCSYTREILKIKPVNYFSINSFRCKQKKFLAVCCPLHYIERTTPTNIHDCSPSEIPADPLSQCCSLDTHIAGLRIFGDSPAGISQYPWLAIVIFDRTVCGGALISGKFVLTAAHCFNNANPLFVRLGEHDLACEELQKQNATAKCSSNAINFEIKKTTLHPNYNTTDKSRRNDIALIELNEMANYADYIRPTCLPSYDISKDPSHGKLFVSGWGYINETAEEVRSVKRYIELPYIPNEVCQERYIHTNSGIELASTQMCAGGIVGEDSCSGDSGGPLMNLIGNKYEVVGLVSFGQVPCGATSAPGVYTKVDDYIEWIYDVILDDNH